MDGRQELVHELSHNHPDEIHGLRFPAALSNRGGDDACVSADSDDDLAVGVHVEPVAQEVGDVLIERHANVLV